MMFSVSTLENISKNNFKNFLDCMRKYIKPEQGTLSSSPFLTSKEHLVVTPHWHSPEASVLTAGHNAEHLRLRVREWNARLSNHTSEFRTTHPKANVAIYNADTLFNKIMDDPNGYGFIDTTSHCKEEGCMWADTLHPTWGVHRILAADIAHSLNMSTRLTNVLNI
jgi:phospholipase/lecithinase/hemolysin